MEIHIRLPGLSEHACDEPEIWLARAVIHASCLVAGLSAPESSRYASTLFLSGGYLYRRICFACLPIGEHLSRWQDTADSEIVPGGGIELQAADSCASEGSLPLHSVVLFACGEALKPPHSRVPVPRGCDSVGVPE